MALHRRVYAPEVEGFGLFGTIGILESDPHARNPVGEEVRPLDRKRVLFVSPHNAARSQMMEGYLRARYGDTYEAFSAGLSPAPLHPCAVRVMAEIGVDISRQRSKPLDEVNEKEIDMVATVCPVFMCVNTMVRQWFPDPGLFLGTEDEKMARFRRLRNDLIQWIDEQFGC